MVEKHFLTMFPTCGPLGVLKYFVITVWVIKLHVAWCPDNLVKYSDTMSLRLPQCDRQTDRQKSYISICDYYDDARCVAVVYNSPCSAAPFSASVSILLATSTADTLTDKFSYIPDITYCMVSEYFTKLHRPCRNLDGLLQPTAPQSSQNRSHLARVFSPSGAMHSWSSAPARCLHLPVRSVRDLGVVVVDQDLCLASYVSHVRNQRVLFPSSPASSGPALIEYWHHSRLSSGLFTAAWTIATAYSQGCQWVCPIASSLFSEPPPDSSSAYQAAHRWWQQSVTRFTGSPTRNVFKLCLTTYKCLHGLARTTLSHQILYTIPSWPAAHTYCALLINTNCSSLVRLPPRWVLGRSAHRAHLRGTHFLGSFATQPSPSTSSDNPSKHICLTVINCV